MFVQFKNPKLYLMLLTDAVLFAAAFLGESLTLSTLAGGAAVIAGGALVAGLRSAASVEGPPVLLDSAGTPDPEREGI